MICFVDFDFICYFVLYLMEVKVKASTLGSVCLDRFKSDSA